MALFINHGGLMQHTLNMPTSFFPKDHFFWDKNKNVNYFLYIYGQKWSFQDEALVWEFNPILYTLDPLDPPLMVNDNEWVRIDPEDIIESIVMGANHQWIDHVFKSYDEIDWELSDESCHWALECSKHKTVNDVLIFHYSRLIVASVVNICCIHFCVI